MKVKDVLRKEVDKLNSFNVEDAILKAQMLLQNILGVSHEYLVMHYEDEISNDNLKEYERNIVDLINDKPIQYILNNQTFYGYNFYVDENVLIPQPDTECLVEEVIGLGNELDKKIKILDICTGSGAIAISLRKNLNCQMYASDISLEALEIARKNTVINNCEVTFIHSNMFENINEKFDIIVSNPPYIETNVIKTLSEEVKQEPLLALDGGKDGLDFYRILTENAGKYLNENGVLAVEIGYNQKDSVIELFEKSGFDKVYSKKDLGNNDRIVVGRWK